ncbi:MAG: ROK family protein [Microbacterium sp.]|jgi:polyphosphate glucokinase|uniref:Polyphosphate glucokinase n=1 Tax=Microbacterium ginsengisoli TaxID=400772 RepID=A0A0F0LZR6_9MICO|nr:MULTISPECIES: ROK family protein [Microbacterium]MAL05699.1 ROK family protein [Microbacterium sp.]MCK9913737.1 ROK family protein [Microbacteriaceae bacterium K1510]KJL39011.1 Polyphosphate glucokinase [Microbacterium ginsengisoli]KQR93066.1 polyphosphate glucokinase [Microbacterium sp. Leaf351]KQS05552.1 polyphosphate glucokinase [Microbacterium sp. Leaf347]
MATEKSRAVGIDIGGTGIKGGVVDLVAGELVSERIKVPTPKGAEPKDVLAAVQQVLETLEVSGSDLELGVAFPAIVKNGRTLSAANVAETWIDFPAEEFFEQGLGRGIHFANDADVAGLAEVRYGAARDAKGLTILTTLGTGIGTALLYNGVLIPNSELGHIERKNHRKDAEFYAAYSAMERDELTWKKWAKRLQWYYSHLEALFSPDLFVVGGGVSKHADEFLSLLKLRTPIIPAVHQNNAGIIGAASLALD